MHAFAKLEDVPELLAESCRIVVEIGECAAAWAGIGAPGRFESLAGVGIDAHATVHAIAANPASFDPAMHAIATREPHVATGLANVPRLADARRSGSVLAVPLLDRRGVLGVLETHAAPDRGFEDDEVSIITELAASLAFAVAARRAEAAAKRTERELRTLGDHSPDMVARFDRNGRYVFVNRAIERATGKPPSEWLGRAAGEAGHIV